MTVHQVRHRLEDAGVSRAPSPIHGEAVRLHGEGRSIREVAAELGTHYRTVWRHLHRAGVARRPRGTAGTELSRPQLERLYLHDRLSLEEVAARFDVPRAWWPATSTGTASPPPGPAGRPGQPRRPLRQPADGNPAVADRLGVREATVRRSLSRHDIPIRRPGRPKAST